MHVSVTKNLITDLCLSLEHSDLLSFWIASKQIFLQDQNNFCCKPIPNTAEFTFMGGKIPLFIEWLLYIDSRNSIKSVWKHGLVGRVFANGPGDLGSIPGWVIPKTLKWYLIPPCLTLSNIRYVSRVKWSNPGKGVVPFPYTSV